MTDLSRLRKRPLGAEGAANAGAAGEIDIAGCATLAYSSEQPDHPVEHLLDGNSGPGATRWISARPDTTEHILVEFDRPQAISRLGYEVEEAERERTQEVRVAVSEDGGRTYRQILVQEYNFSPRGATYCSLVSPLPNIGNTGMCRNIVNSGVRNASPGPNITAGRINLAEGKASSTAASPLPRLRM